MDNLYINFTSKKNLENFKKVKETLHFISDYVIFNIDKYKVIDNFTYFFKRYRSNITLVFVVYYYKHNIYSEIIYIKNGKELNNYTLSKFYKKQYIIFINNCFKRYKMNLSKNKSNIKFIDRENIYGNNLSYFNNVHYL
jgi:hypothetical protein